LITVRNAGVSGGINQDLTFNLKPSIVRQMKLGCLNPKPSITGSRIRFGDHNPDHLNRIRTVIGCKVIGGDAGAG
jgi:hypothetical protein